MDSSEEKVEQSLSELEQNALERRQRLKELRARFKDGGQREEEEDGENVGGGGADEPITLLFRSYKSTNKVHESYLGTTKKEIDALERNIVDQLEASEDTAVQDVLDLKTLAPRKVDWDLRRGIEDKMDKLERRTRKAINQIIRKRLTEEAATKDGQMDLADAVGSIGEER